MSNSIKQIVNLVVNFVEKTIIPLVSNTSNQASKALDQWMQVKKFFVQSDHIQIWKVQKLLIDLPLRPINAQIKKPATQPSQKITNNIRPSSFLQNDQWKYRKSQNLNIELDKKQNFLFSDPLSKDIKKQEQKQEIKSSVQSFENLLSSFRRLCTNFENNHKKLIMDKQIISHGAH